MAKEEPNPFAQFKAPPAAKVKVEANPFEQFKPAKVKRERTGMDKATQIAGVTTDAFLPYATAAGLGAATAAIPTAGFGAPFGAGAGMLALGIGDLGTSVYNAGASLFDADRVPLPSETISKMYRNVGIGRAPETTGEQVYSDIMRAVSSGGSQAKGFQLAENAATSPQMRNFMNMMGQNTRGQVGASVGAAGVPSVASNYFDVTNPYALMALSVPAAVVGGKAATPSVKPVTAAALKEESGKLYRAMEAEGVQIRPQAMTDLDAAIRPTLGNMRYNPVSDKLVNEVVRMFRLQAGQPMSYAMLEDFRKSIRDLPYTQSSAGRGSPRERAIIAALDDTIDDFMDGLTPAQTTGDAAAANAFLTKARTVRARGYQTETLEDAFKNATTTSSKQDATKSFPRALRDEFGKIAGNDRKLLKFDKPTQELIKKVANGTATQKVLAALGKFSPSARIFGAQVPFIGYGAQYAPGTAAAITGVQLLTATAKGAANRMTKGQANRALVNASQPSGGIKPGGPGYFALSPAAQQNLMAQDRAKKAEERRRMGF
jgi:hypothetical protein